MKLVLIGAGSAQFGFGMLGDIFQSKMLAGSHVVLVDIDAAALSRVHRVAEQLVADQGLPFTLSSTTDRCIALQDASVVVISIEVGKRFPLWDEDWRRWRRIPCLAHNSSHCFDCR
jgi:alpha-galactosidase